MGDDISNADLYGTALWNRIANKAAAQNAYNNAGINTGKIANNGLANTATATDSSGGISDWFKDVTKVNDKGISKLGSWMNTAGKGVDILTSGYGMYLANQKSKMEKDAYNSQKIQLAQQDARRAAFAQNAGNSAVS